MKRPAIKYLRWTPLAVFGAIVLAFVVGSAADQTMYGSMRDIKHWLIAAPAIALLAAAMATSRWRQLSNFDRVCAVGPLAAMVAFVLIGLARGVA